MFLNQRFQTFTIADVKPILCRVLFAGSKYAQLGSKFSGPESQGPRDYAILRKAGIGEEGGACLSLQQ